ncbi:hypothetical protein MmTuc01_0228 [Methanosarcina mazei Tuc01]|uniref:Uncharacterized protein n=1 Tax=Methanosarcina mazei Tuc01 TaxID=1236903 RepID=M1P5L9_METMZ|nr:hypothetical protein MmTuc01_0228 [Methanosarcina mazei Tuc01]
MTSSSSILISLKAYTVERPEKNPGFFRNKSGIVNPDP